ncbi:tetratricopeptide repeat protein [Kangiella sp. TOML190]|uniref:tetratricopeptide repeat protein n=1 Tax=Kangiella sp. TOML190 TaxID=2931351 RepID=UPI00203A6BBA|nr:tetratricopeptide repeat protein [Kangiella sp. TOML190]
MGIFLAGSWTALEFTQWAVGRYSLSPDWEEVLVVFLLLCLPLILVLAWHHGAPGKQHWTLFEKIFIPLYGIAIPLTLHQIYQDTDLSRTVETVMVQDASGKMQKKAVAKSEFIKPLIVYPLKNLTNKPELDPLAAISSEVINRDLQQNIFFSSLDVSMVSNAFKSDNQSFKNQPLSFQINFAKERKRDYLINGSLNQVGNNYQIKIALYNSKNGRKVRDFSAENSNYFSAIDELTQKVNDHFFPNGLEFTDLPIEDLYTNNWSAFESYVQARIIELFGNNKQESETLYIKALEQDPTFSMAAFVYSLYNIQQNKIVKARELSLQAQKHHNYRFTDRERFPVNATSYFLTQQRDKGFHALDQWILLFPTDWQAYFMKAQFLQFNKGSEDEAVTNLKKVIELDPSQSYLWDMIGDIYNAAGKYQLALDAYEKYSQSNPNNPIAYKNLGDLYIKEGNFDSVISSYQKALSIDPNNPNVLANLANAYSRTGQFQRAEQNFLLAIENSNTPAVLLGNRRRLADFYWQYGKRKEAVKYLRQGFADYSQTESKTKAMQVEALHLWQYHLAGEVDLAKELVEQAVQYAQENEEDILIINTQIGKAMLLNQLGQSDVALTVFDELIRIGESYADSNTAVINYHKGMSYFHNQQYSQALEAFAELNQRFPDRVDIMEWPAKTSLAMQDWDKAKEQYEQLLILAPAFPAYNLAMAKIMIANQQIPQAKEHLQKALDGWQNADIEFEEMLEAKKLLASL